MSRDGQPTFEPGVVFDDDMIVDGESSDVSKSNTDELDDVLHHRSGPERL